MRFKWLDRSLQTTRRIRVRILRSSSRAIFEHLLQLLPQRELPFLTRYISATAAVLAVVLTRLIFPLPNLPFLLFVPVLMAVGFILGLSAGLYATILSAAFASYLFIKPDFDHSFSTDQWSAIAFYAIINAAIVSVCAALREILERRDADIAALRRSEQRLAVSEQRLNLALGAASGMVGIWDWDLETDLVYADTNFVHIYDVDPNWAVQGAPFADYIKTIHPDDIADFRAELERQFAGEAEFLSEYRVIQRDGSQRWMLARGKLVRNAEGKPVRFPGASVDITDRKHAEVRRLALLELSDRLRELDDTAEMAFAAAEILGRALNVSRAGYGTIDVVDETINIERDWNAPSVSALPELMHFRDYGSYIEDLKRGEIVVFADARKDPRTAANASALEAISARAVLNLPITEFGGVVALLYLTHAQVRIWTSADVALVREFADRARSAIERRRAEHSLRDLTASLEAQVASRTYQLEQSEARFKAYFDASPEYLYLLRLTNDDRLVYDDLNTAGEALYERQRSEVLGHTPSELFDISTSEIIERYARECLLTGQTLRYETSRTFPSGSLITLNVVVASIGMTHGGDRLVLFCGRDLTDQRIAEEALRQSQKMEAVGQLTGGLAHDFNNLLTGISGSLQLMQTRLQQGRVTDLERYIGPAQGAADRAAALTHRLLAFSRRQTLDPKATDINRLIADIEELVRRTVGPSIHLEVVGAVGLWPTFVDPNQLENAFLNLCINARDAMPDGGKLTVETGNRWMDERTSRQRELSPGQYVSLCVSDSGTGMTPETIKRAFDPFFTTKPLGMGTGLGLSMAYGFARQSGGQIRIYSEVGQGTMVCIYLPRHFGETYPEAPAAKPAEVPRAEHGQTVLVVDDEATVRMLVTEVLEELGYTAVEAADGVSGLRVLQSLSRVDLLVSDVGLPGGMNGRQLADAARIVRPDLKVLFITGYAENAAIGHGHLARGMQVMTKPFAMDELATRIKAIIDDE